MLIKQFSNKFRSLRLSERLCMPVFSYTVIINKSYKHLKPVQYLNKLHKETTFPGTGLHFQNPTSDQFYLLLIHVGLW